MAGDWIKMRMSLRTHPKVVRIASALRADKCPDRLRVIGALHAVWSLADEHSEDGHLPGYTVEALDESIGWPGFSTAMQEVGWLIDGPQGLVLPRFDEHNGASAKRRAQDAERKRRDRKTSAGDADGMRTREEKEKRTTTTTLPTTTALQATKSKAEEEPTSTSRRTRLELTELPDTWRLWAAEKCAAVDALAAFEKFRNHHLAKGSLMADWPAAWRTWCGREVEFASGRGAPGLGKQAALEARNAAVAAAWSPPVDEVAP